MHKIVQFFGKTWALVCDGRCDKAWGLNRRPRINFDEKDPDDIAWLSDNELGEAPEDPGTYEGGHGKPSSTPLSDPNEMNKWCARECERSNLECLANVALEGETPRTFNTRVYNQPWKHRGP